jgi:hypothetical protein
MAILIGTADGVHVMGAERPAVLSGHRIDAVTRGDDAWWVLTDATDVWILPDHTTPSRVAAITDARVNCLLPRRDEILLGAEAAQLYHLPASGDEPTLDEAFTRAPGRDDWYTPWGGPPDVRSMGLDVDDTIYLNVHVGGVLRYRDDDPVWRDTMDINADAHEVIAHPEIPGTAIAATARGLAISRDGATTWEFRTDGLHARYCRAVAAADDRVFVSASRSNRGENAAVYRTDLDGSLLERCTGDLPQWFTNNINTGCLQAARDTVLIGDADGTLYQSEDGGTTWFVAAKELPAIRCIGLATDPV